MNMNTLLKKLAVIAAVITGFLTGVSAQEKYLPSGTYQFATREDGNLFLDEYLAAPGIETSLNGVEKPAIVFVF